jgi:hypothetical protein
VSFKWRADGARPAREEDNRRGKRAVRFFHKALLESRPPFLSAAPIDGRDRARRRRVISGWSFAKAERFSTVCVLLKLGLATNMPSRAYWKQDMSKIRKIITTGLIATTLAAAVLASTPASAWYRRYGWYGGGWGWGGPAIAAGVLGGLALGAVAAGAGSYPYYPGYYGNPAAYGYPYAARFCVVRNPVYDDWGNFVGYQRMRVAC